MNSAGNQSDYRTSWEKYVPRSEENRFLSDSEEDLLKICDCIDMNPKSSGQEKTSGGIPIHYANDKIYVLKKGPNTNVEGESGSKKSRTVVRGQLITTLFNGDSAIVTDPKGEISSDPKILWLLERLGVQIHIVDLRSFDKDGYNPLAHTFEMMQQGKRMKAMASINNFTEMLKNDWSGAEDPYWNIMGGNLIRFSSQLLLIALSQIPGGERAFNISSVKSFIRQDREKLKKMISYIADQEPLCNSIIEFNEIIQMEADRTYGCIVSSADALLSDFAFSEELLKMMSIKSFDIRTFYERSSVLFLVFPDEHKTYQMLTGYIIDQLYQILVEDYAEKYQNRKAPVCSIKNICDEIANLRINDLSSKVSASRSRQIDWTLVFQSERQMREAYKKDWPTIAGNCKNKIYLGSSDYEILQNISEQVGTTRISGDEGTVPLVTVDDLRKMKKEIAYKDALLLTGNHIYCAQLPDYDQFKFLKKSRKKLPKRLLDAEVSLYTPEDLYKDYITGRISFKEQGSLIKKMRNDEEEEVPDMKLESILDDWF